MISRTENVPMSAFPDPDRQPEFYDSVPSKRLIAWVIDTVIIVILTVLAVPFTLFLGLFFLVPLFFMLGFVYRVITIANGSATLGMRFMAVELRQGNGQRMDLGSAFLHTLGYTVSMSIPVLQVISIVLMLTTARGQGLSDHVMGSTALNRRK